MAFVGGQLQLLDRQQHVILLIPSFSLNWYQINIADILKFIMEFSKDFSPLPYDPIASASLFTEQDLVVLLQKN